MAGLEPLSEHNARLQEKKECYLCAKTPAETPERKLTRDHLPPKNLFLSPRPSNLISLPCCTSCNNQAHQDDEYFRLVVTGYYNTNPLGKQTWKDKAAGSTLKKKRLRAKAKAIAGSLKRIALITPTGLQDAVEVQVEQAPLNRVLTRITKGLLARYYPEVDRGSLKFQLFQIDQFKLNDPFFAQLQKLLRYLHRGESVYRCWHTVEAYTFKGYWIHMFFDSAVFQVEHLSDRRIVPPW